MSTIKKAIENGSKIHTSVSIKLEHYQFAKEHNLSLSKILAAAIELYKDELQTS